MTFIKKNFRPLSIAEKDLIKFLLRNKPNNNKILKELDDYEVVELLDGSMGSLEFKSTTRKGVKSESMQCIAEGNFLDSDGVLVSVALNANSNNTLTELDIWKVNFEPLKGYPCPKNSVKIEKLPADLR